jgi:hypothetical protein
LQGWSVGGEKFLAFPFSGFTPRTLPKGQDFWMYMYYREGLTEFAHLKRAVKYRVRVVACSESRFAMPDTCEVSWGGEKMWFLCDKGEEIAKPSGALFTDADFRHADGKNLSSTMRTSIPPVERVGPDLRVVASYP